MRRRLVLTLLGALAGAPLAAAPLPAHAVDAPQPALSRDTIVIVGHGGVRHPFTVELALTEQQQETGLMFRKSVPADTGMLFDWRAPRESQMWMKNTLVPLDMVFINEDGTIRHIAENTVPESLAVIDSHGPVRATLELQGGITEKLDIRVGDKVEGKFLTAAP
ncbi:MAG TPA: DUF192 domain-containing protein [Acetobacteraceae bacterium]|nr:DUF192 domain-containing protein [Acetobacteraceae bacterium]